MNYVEWLRVRNCLRIVAIILAILVVLAVILRISLARQLSPEGWVAQMTTDPRTKVTHSVLADGTKRTVVDDVPERTRVVIDDRGAAGKHIVITEPSSHSHNESYSHVGNILSSRTYGGVKTTVIDTNGSVPLLYYMAFADIMGLIVATILAAPFAREIDGHLEISLTKPCPRERFALGTMAVDAVGILVSSLLTIVALYLCQLLFETWRLDFSGENARGIVMGAALPVAWYALLCAGTTWLCRGYGAVLGFAWPVAIVIAALTQLEPSNTVALVVRDAAWVLSRLDPLTYVKLGGMSSATNDTYGGMGFGLRLSIEVLLLVVYGALAVWQWRRVEA